MSKQTKCMMTYRCTREGCGVIFFTPAPQAIFEHSLNHFHEEVEAFANQTGEMK